MTKKNRKTLKKYFQKGKLPSEQAFAYLIDSMLNTIDDGFEKTPDQGLKISSLGRSDRLAGFYREIETKSAIWSIEFGDPGDSLLFKNRQGTVLSLTPSPNGEERGRVGVNTDRPGTALEVAGTVSATGRMGTFRGKHRNGRVPADGKPHTLIENLDGCRAFEVVAGAGGRDGSGKYALIHAFALTTFKSRDCIAVHQAYYGSRCNRIKIWWEGKQQDFALKIQTRTCYGDRAAIQYHITDLWFDPYMENCTLGQQA